MPTKQPYLLAAGLWLALIVAMFWPVIFHGKVLAPLDIMDSLLRPWASAEKIEVHNSFAYDAISQYLPYDYSVYQSFQQDGYIGWNPYTHSGSSIVENTMLCPGDWRHHLYRFLSFWHAWNIGILLQFFIAGLGMLVFLKRRGVPAAYALIAVISFAFYSQFFIWLHHRWILAAMCWAPWILWALERMRLKHRLIDPLSIILIGLAFRGGHLQTCLFVVLLVVLIALAEWWSQPDRWKLSGIWRSFPPYALCGFFGAILALDVFVETVPALLHGKRNMPTRDWIDGICALPTLVTCVFPGVMGTPQGLDAAKIFRSDLFSIKFLGAVPLFLACIALFRRQAPLAAKFLFVFGIVIPFTPADQWLYSRFTVVFALGAAWLAAWLLFTISSEPPSRIWRKSMIFLLAVMLLWTGASVVLSLNLEWLTEKIHSFVRSEIPAGRAARLPWMLEKADYFLHSCMIWAPRNLAMLFFIAGGICCCMRIHSGNPKAQVYAVLAALCAFGEITLFSSSWITFSNKPASASLYKEADWIDTLRANVPDGTILCLDRSDFDYMQLNTPSSYGIRFCEGYETVTPKRINPPAGNPFDPEHCAQSGVSHILASPEKAPEEIAGFVKIIETDEFVLFRNPLFTGVAHAQLTNGSNVPLKAHFTSLNRREIEIPAGTQSITLLESFNPGWKYSLDGHSWQPAESNELHTIRIALEHPVTVSNRVLLQYRPAYQSYYRPVTGITLTALLAFGCLRLLRGTVTSPKIGLGSLARPTSPARAGSQRPTT